MTQTIEVTPTWVNLTDTAGLLEDGRYICQNIGAKGIFLFESETIPDASEIGILLDTHKYIGILQNGTILKFWARVNNYDPTGSSGRMVVSSMG